MKHGGGSAMFQLASWLSLRLSSCLLGSNRPMTVPAPAPPSARMVNLCSATQTIIAPNPMLQGALLMQQMQGKLSTSPLFIYVAYFIHCVSNDSFHHCVPYFCLVVIFKY